MHKVGSSGYSARWGPYNASEHSGEVHAPPNPRHEKGASAQVSVVNSGAQRIQPKSPGRKGQNTPWPPGIEGLSQGNIELGPGQYKTVDVSGVRTV